MVVYSIELCVALWVKAGRHGQWSHLVDGGDAEVRGLPHLKPHVTYREKQRHPYFKHR